MEHTDALFKHVRYDLQELICWLMPYDPDYYYYNKDAAKLLGIRASKEPLDGLQRLLEHGFLNRGDIPILRRLIRSVRDATEEQMPGYREEGYEMAAVIKETVIAELERIISLIDDKQHESHNGME